MRQQSRRISNLQNPFSADGVEGLSRVAVVSLLITAELWQVPGGGNGQRSRWSIPANEDCMYHATRTPSHNTCLLLFVRHRTAHAHNKSVIRTEDLPWPIRYGTVRRHLGQSSPLYTALLDTALLALRMTMSTRLEPITRTNRRNATSVSEECQPLGSQLTSTDHLVSVIWTDC